jgi:hypothetical protein
MSLDIAARVHTISRNTVAKARLDRIRRRARDYVLDFIPDTAAPGERRVLAQELFDASRLLHAQESGLLATDCREAAKGGAR